MWVCLRTSLMNSSYPEGVTHGRFLVQLHEACRGNAQQQREIFLMRLLFTNAQQGDRPPRVTGCTECGFLRTASLMLVFCLKRCSTGTVKLPKLLCLRVLSSEGPKTTNQKQKGGGENTEIISGSLSVSSWPQEFVQTGAQGVICPALPCSGEHLCI